MPSTNGRGSRRAILYARVSTEEQARSGYSLAQQIEALRAYAEREGYEVLEEVLDPGHSGSSLDRPGMDRVRGLVQNGGVAAVLAQDRDRFSREPAYTYLLRREFEEHGTKLKALNDRGDESAEGELTDGILDQLAKFERAKIKERTRRGKLRRAREGKIVATVTPDFGYRYNTDRTGYVVDEEAMSVVRRIFYMVGVEGLAMRATKRALEAEGVLSPMGKRYWHQTTIRRIVLDDVYRPHTAHEVAALVSPEVAARLDAKGLYGVWWFNRKRTKTEQVAVEGPEGRVYKRRTRSFDNPREEWIAVPVAGSGIPREWADAARARVEGGVRSPSQAGHRFWELSGGMCRCGGCGRTMMCARVPSRNGKLHYYYRCSERARNGKDACTVTKMAPAGKTEARVWEFVKGLLLEPERLRAGLERMIQQEREGLRGDPEREAKAWLERVVEADRKRSGFQDMAAEGLITMPELREKLADLEETRRVAERELELLRGRREELERLEREKDVVLETYAGLTLEGLEELEPEERHRVYQMLSLAVLVNPEGTIGVSGVFGEAENVCELWQGSRSRRSRGPGSRRPSPHPGRREGCA
ncbi:MAG: recombinase family protein [Actinomycetota bacterium]|nr:recombinase family protein [Actinomycetota bacterium]